MWVFGYLAAAQLVLLKAQVCHLLVWYLAGFKRLLDVLHLQHRSQKTRIDSLLSFVPEPIWHKARDIGAQLDYQLQDYAPWQIAVYSALAVLLLVQLLQWANTTSEGVREQGMKQFASPAPLTAAITCLFEEHTAPFIHAYRTTARMQTLSLLSAG